MRKISNLLAALTMAMVPFLGFAQATAAHVSGLVKDNQKPLEAATVNLLRATDSALVKASVTDKAGAFTIDKIKEGKYLVLIQLVGYQKFYSPAFEVNAGKTDYLIAPVNLLTDNNAGLKTVVVSSSKPFIEQKTDRMVVNVDASPTNVGATALDVLEKSPGISVDKDGNISLKGKQGVTVMIDNRPTYLSATELANYLKGLPASALEQVEIMTNPSSKYDAAGNAGIINLKTKKNKTKGFNGSVSLTHTQGVYGKPGGSLNLNYRSGKANFFVNGGYTDWKGYNTLDINRRYFDAGTKNLNAIFTQSSFMKHDYKDMNLKAGMDYYLTKRTTVGFVLSGFYNPSKNSSSGTSYLKNSLDKVDSIVNATSNDKNTWKNASLNLNLRHQFDSAGTEITADADGVIYRSGNRQMFDNLTSYPDFTVKDNQLLSGYLPININIYSFKSDFTHPLKKDIKLEAGIKSSYVATDNTADYSNMVDNKWETDYTKSNHFVYHENINAAYVNLNKQYKKWGIQAGLRFENTNYSGHQFGNVQRADSAFKRSYSNLFPTLYVSYQANTKNQFAVNYGRRIDRPAYEDLNPFLFFIDKFTYEAGNPFLQPQFTQNVELSHTYNNFLTTTLNYSYTRDLFSETFEQSDYATIVRRGNIGKRENAGLAISAQVPVQKWWTAIIYTNVNYNKFSGVLYGENINVEGTTFMANLNNQFKFKKGWSAEVSGFYRSTGIEGQVLIKPMGQLSAGVSKQLFKDKASIRFNVRDILYTQVGRGQINFQQTEATFKNTRDSRVVSVSFTYRFGKPLKDAKPRRNTGGADDESNRVKGGGNN